jgi:transcription elongation factor GreA
VVDLGSQVQLEFVDDGEQVAYQVVGRLEADLAQGKVAFDSPLGQAIMKQAAGTTVSVSAPAGTYQVKIISVN